MSMEGSVSDGGGGGCRDRISELPEGVLQNIVGFLPAQEAVRTCVLARPWRHVWRSMRRLRIRNISYIDDSKDARDFECFVNRLLLLREPGSTLDEVNFEFDTYMHEEYTMIHSWIQHALLCQARVLAIKNRTECAPITLNYTTLVSPHLRRLELDNVQLKGNTLDFSSCEALEDLEIRDCDICTERIVSQSIKRLSVVECIFTLDSRTRISVPNLVWLLLDINGGKAPLLESMPALETAFVYPYSSGDDYYCDEGQSDGCCGNCAECRGDNGHDEACVLLGGLSSATSLELISRDSELIFSRDLRWCPTFSKLKSILLNDWCVVNDLCQLVCILEHSPVLEKLTLQLSERTKFTSESEGSYHRTGKLPAISKHLSIVEIKCEEVDERVYEVLKFLNKVVIQINIIRTSKWSASFSLKNY